MSPLDSIFDISLIFDSISWNLPPKYEHTNVLSVLLIIEQPDGESLVLGSKDDMKLIGSTTQYPPKGDLYQLANPVEFMDPENPGTAVAVLQKLPAKCGGL